MVSIEARLGRVTKHPELLPTYAVGCCRYGGQF
jgi:hypothetical protein